MTGVMQLTKTILVALAYVAALILLGLNATHAAVPAAVKQKNKPAFGDTDTKNPRGVIDLGQIEVEGEVRRPQVTWIDSQRRLRDQMPGFHQQEFYRLEAQLLAPMTTQELRSKRRVQ